jgi:hypothetical protein
MSNNTNTDNNRNCVFQNESRIPDNVDELIYISIKESLKYTVPEPEEKIIWGPPPDSPPRNENHDPDEY